ncbi:hypothetical protein [Ferrovum myxofaciens]|uniref:Uncharacterized protein n=1 Tax=mine drainage metagenome TaxID=410659 RepID=A0A3P3ZNI2_9ZZZZ|nr:hypothetical protein [Ferrovum myxofaciens]
MSNIRRILNIKPNESKTVILRILLMGIDSKPEDQQPLAVASFDGFGSSSGQRSRPVR